MSEGRALNVAGLLRIDVDAELRKLCQSLLVGPHQLACELVRRSLRDRATQIDVKFARRRLTLHHNGDALGSQRLESMAVMMRATESSAARHGALVLVECGGDLPLVAPLALGATQIVLTSTNSRGGHRLTLVPNGPPELMAIAAGPPATTITVVGLKLDSRRCARWLRALCRFAPAQITVDRESIGHLRPTGLAARDLTDPLVGSIAIPHTGDGAQVWLTEYGVVSAHVVLPHAPAVEAVVELGHDGPAGDPVRVRDAFCSHDNELIKQTLDLLRAAAPGLAPGAARRRGALVTLRALRQGRFLRELATLPVFSILEADGTPAVTDLVRLRGVVGAAGASHALWVLYPEADPGAHILPDAMVLVADDDERSLLANALGARLVTPQPRPGSSWPGLVRRAWHTGRRSFGNRLAAILRPGAGRPLEPQEMSAPERALILGLSPDDKAHAPAARLTAGAGPIRHRAGRPAELPQQNPTVAAAVAAYRQDSRWLYPASYALLGVSADPPAPLRARWRAGKG